MQAEYKCADCHHRFPIELSDAESSAALRSDRTDACPQCGQRIGRGKVQCRNCETTFTILLPHWQVSCTLASGNCPGCAQRFESLCVC